MHRSRIKEREKTREKAAEYGGEMIFELKKYDIFQFPKNTDDVDKFKEWAKKHDEIDVVEDGHNFRIGVKYRRSR